MDYTEEEKAMIADGTVSARTAAKYLGLTGAQNVIWGMENDRDMCRIGTIKHTINGRRIPTIYAERLIAYKHGLDLKDDFLDDEDEDEPEWAIRLENTIEKLIKKLEAAG